jgi:cholesterol transport system auxiliary component
MPRFFLIRNSYLLKVVYKICKRIFISPKILNLKLFKNSFSLILPFFLTSCIQIFPDPGESPQFIELQPQLNLKMNIHSVSWQLGVEEPLADSFLNSVKIPIRINSDNETSYIKYTQGKEWRTRLPLMVQSLIITSLETSGKIKGVARLTQGLDANYILITEIKNFEFNLSESSQNSSAYILLTAKMLYKPERKIIATKVFQKKIDSPTQEFSDLLSALKKASSILFSDLTTWILEQHYNP